MEYETKKAAPTGTAFNDQMFERITASMRH